MAKKDEISLNPEAHKALASESSTLEESVAAVTEVVQSVVGRALGGLNALSAERAKLAGRAIDLVEATTQSVVRLARDASDGQTAIERTLLTSADRVLSSWVRWGGGSALAVANAASLKTPQLPPSGQPESPRAQA